ncbi:cyclopropane-fatty-acyl-phospholipid synthase [Leptospira broomii serovar Hurstbridge str. 5399]|uniref:Cyclopropane-fatty-acyl-phospholipid synthase n=1 Tax=Leptospira broomii serovar Hurstbridge str. 5399 TaxID=1049789 RepID=T0EYD7_9LEPT|nr:methyltransferase domain-containing protein [Leptospira broomii]EQA43865.1 cyclopropane-fatty-acyl-phospholipid synthase [Leptospira broomii serovar Hurstbridge str. 5399]
MKTFSVFLACITISCAGIEKLKFSKIYARAGWQYPEQVVEILEIKHGQFIADLGAGSGYFAKYFSDAVGETGRIYVNEVDPELVLKLQNKFHDRDPNNVRAILGNQASANLPEKVDLIFSCNTYHHLENRPAYFSELKKYLKPGGRIAIIDHKDNLTGILRIFVTKGHWSSVEMMQKEMKEAGFEESNSFDFLPTQNFLIFKPIGEKRK